MLETSSYYQFSDSMKHLIPFIENDLWARYGLAVYIYEQYNHNNLYGNPVIIDESFYDKIKQIIRLRIKTIYAKKITDEAFENCNDIKAEGRFYSYFIGNRGTYGSIQKFDFDKFHNKSNIPINKFFNPFCTKINAVYNRKTNLFSVLCYFYSVICDLKVAFTDHNTENHSKTTLIPNLSLDDMIEYLDLLKYYFGQHTEMQQIKNKLPYRCHKTYPEYKLQGIYYLPNGTEYIQFLLSVRQFFKTSADLIGNRAEHIIKQIFTNSLYLINDESIKLININKIYDNFDKIDIMENLFISVLQNYTEFKYALSDLKIVFEMFNNMTESNLNKFLRLNINNIDPNILKLNFQGENKMDEKTKEQCVEIGKAIRRIMIANSNHFDDTIINRRCYRYKNLLLSNKPLKEVFVKITSDYSGYSTTDMFSLLDEDTKSIRYEILLAMLADENYNERIENAKLKRQLNSSTNLIELNQKTEENEDESE